MLCFRKTPGLMVIMAAKVLPCGHLSLVLSSVACPDWLKLIKMLVEHSEFEVGGGNEMEDFLDLPTDPLWPKTEAVMISGSTASGRRGLNVCAMEHLSGRKENVGVESQRFP